MEVMLIDWTSSANKSSVISSMMASMDSVWLTTAVQIIFCTPKATSTNFKPSDLCGHQISGAPRHRRDVVLVTASA